MNYRTRDGPYLLRVADTSAGSDAEAMAIYEDVNNTKAVVCNFQHRDLSWLAQARIPTVEVGTCSEAGAENDSLCGLRLLGESRPWMKWIIQNYENLGAKYLAFLHGELHSWHSQDVLSRVRMAKPANVEMLSDHTCTWKQETGEDLIKDKVFPPGQTPGLNIIAQALYGKSFLEVWSSFGMAFNYRCCSEMVVNEDAVKKVDKRIFEALLSMFEKNPGHPWGYIMERYWQNLFSRTIVRPVEEIVALFANFSHAPFHDSKVRTNMTKENTTKPGDLTDDRNYLEWRHSLSRYIVNPTCVPGEMLVDKHKSS